jgi:hypothetical protein
MRQGTEAPRGGLASGRQRGGERAEMQSEWFLDFLCEVSKEGAVGDLVRELLRALTSGSTAVTCST